MTGSRPRDERPLWRRAAGWPWAWRMVAWLVAWPWLLASRWWDRGHGSRAGRAAAVAVVVAFALPWTLAVAVLVSSAVPPLDGEDAGEGGFDLTLDPFAPLDQPVEAPASTTPQP